VEAPDACLFEWKGGGPGTWDCRLGLWAGTVPRLRRLYRAPGTRPQSLDSTIAAMSSTRKSVSTKTDGVPAGNPRASGRNYVFGFAPRRSVEMGLEPGGLDEAPKRRPNAAETSRSEGAARGRDSYRVAQSPVGSNGSGAPETGIARALRHCVRRRGPRARRCPKRRSGRARTATPAATVAP
jgi:hypothetical protein